MHLRPGSPREWRGKELPHTVTRDMGAQYIDQHSHRMPCYPLVPLFRAVEYVTEHITGEPVDWPSVDFVAARNSLRKLLLWITDDNGWEKEFRIDVEFVGKGTVFLNRWEKRNREEANDIGFPSYGHNFIMENTAVVPGCQGGIAHHRITKYVCVLTQGNHHSLSRGLIILSLFCRILTG